MKPLRLRIFQMNLNRLGMIEFYAAYTNVEAMTLCWDKAEWTLDDIDPLDEVIEIDKIEWDKYIVINDNFDAFLPEFNWKRKTFRQFMESNREPGLIAHNDNWNPN